MRFLSALIGSVFCFLPLFAFQLPQNNKHFLHQYQEAERLLYAFENDSAHKVLQTLLDSLDIKKERNTDFGFKVQLKLAFALERNDRNLEALDLLYYLMPLSEIQKDYFTQAEIHLLFARLHEKIGQLDKCQHDLNKAISIIEKYKVDSIQAIYFNRKSSYHRIKGEPDSAIIYANKVFGLQNQKDQTAEVAVAHLILGLIYQKDKLGLAEEHLQAAKLIWKKMGDYNGVAAIMLSLSNIHSLKKDFKKALSYIDSAIIVVEGKKKGWITAFINLKKSKVFEAMQELDSALIYHQRYFDAYVEYANGQKLKELSEVEAKYNNELKANKIEEQELKLEREQMQRFWLWLSLISLFFFAAIITFLYRKLKRANEKTIEQSIAISQINQDLKETLERKNLLLGEVHHRVKNNLQFIISLLELQSYELKSKEAQEVLLNTSRRIYSMAAIHEMVVQDNNNQTISLDDYIRYLCARVLGSMSESPNVNIEYQIVDQSFNLDTLIPLGTIVNELLTNSMKHALIPNKKLEVSIAIYSNGNGYCLRYQDNGPGIPLPEDFSNKKSMGWQILQSMARQLNGHIESFNDQGAVFLIFFDAKNLDQS